jgi:hypothetical protein
MSNSMFPRFAFAYGAAFALFYAIAHARGLALFTPRKASSFSVCIVPGMLPIPSWISSRPRCTGTGGLLPPLSARSSLA